MKRSLAVCVALLLLSCQGDPKTPDYWEKAALSTSGADARARVYDNLRSSGNLTDGFAPMLQTQLASEPSSTVRAAIVRNLAQLHLKTSVPSLEKAVDFSDRSETAKVNREIATALGKIGDPSSVPTLLKLLNSKDPYTQSAAITALADFRAKEAVAPLSQIALDDRGEPALAAHAVEALGDIADPSAVPLLMKMLVKQHPRGPEFYAEASLALYRIGKPASDALLPVLSGKDAALNAWAKKSGISELALSAKAAQVLGDLQDSRAESALLSRLAFKSEDARLQMFMHQRAADALGRLRSTAAVKPLCALLEKQELQGKAHEPAADSDPLDARLDFNWALARIGSRDALPTLIKTAPSGIWDTRRSSASAVTLIGDEREQKFLEKLAADEPAATARDCEEFPGYGGCSNPAELGKKHAALLQAMAKKLDVAKECAKDAACWTKKLDDADAGVRQRAGLELGRMGAPADAVVALARHASDADLEARTAIIQGAQWALARDSAARAKASAELAALEKQLADEHGHTQYAVVDQELLRLVADLKR